MILFINLLLARVEATSWSPATQLTFTDPAWDTDPAIVQTADGTVWVAWASDRERVQNDIYYKTSTDNGTSWTSDTQLTSNSSLDVSPSIMQHHNGTIWVAWYRDMAGNYDIFYKTSPDNGLTWSPETRLTTDSSWDLDPSIIQALDGTIWAVWTSYRNNNYDIFYKTSTNNGVSWSPETPLTTHGDFDEASAITQARDGSLWVVWHSDRKGKQYDLYYETSSDHGLTWSEDTPLTTDSKDDMSPTVMNSNEGRIWIAWTSARIGDQFEIYYKTSDIISVPIPGDVNGDGKVDASDLSDLSKAYGSSPGDLNWNPNCDFNKDNKVDASDLFDLSKNYEKTS